LAEFLAAAGGLAVFFLAAAGGAVFGMRFSR
jgi:hypothetical protein